MGVGFARKPTWLANPCELRIRITDVLCPHHVGGDYGEAIRTIVYQEGLRITVGFVRIRLACESMRIANPHHKSYPPPFLGFY